MKKPRVLFAGSVLANSLLIGSLMASPNALAAEVTANVGLTSDYLFRGISQSGTEAAIQGGFDVDFGNGFYAGTWGSSVDFANSLELDYFVGYQTDIGQDMNFDVGYLYYDYPASDLDDAFAELYANLSWSGLTLSANYSDDFYLNTGSSLYLHGVYEYEVSDLFTVSAHFGYSDFERSSTNAGANENHFLQAGADSYTDYNISVSKSFSGVDFSLGYFDTNLSDAECGAVDLCDATVVFSLSKTL